ncbi:glycosyltransferase [Bacteroides fragilis]|uniref:glycosyltransferase n=1 Tax=Bacteroides TaxID=816 RepID=UPI00202FC068|nr:glycosyltransferase [Bacteroides fragilis]MCM0220078.1 glycosyltransferase [Bacteroides fragilis]MCM0236864.1 glycosyltransferase [Bacteroides fragilis]MCM0265825.1 glycosyltransferase [Bacteroides fragilis]
MKILQIIDCMERGGGAEKFVLSLSLALKKRNLEVEVLSIIPPSKDNLDFIDALRKASIPVHILNQNNKLYSVVNIFRLKKFFKCNVYDIVHVHLFPAIYFAALAKLKSTKLIYTEHSTDNRRRHFLLFKILDRIVYSRYNKVVCISSKVKELLVKHVGNMNFTVIPNGIFISEYTMAKKLLRSELVEGMNEDVKIVLMSARMVKGKDYLTVFKALAYLPSDIHLICLGTGYLENEYKIYCKKEGLLSRVHFLGLRNNVSQILKTADVIVLSSDHEGFSLSMLEAMASGNPFIASDVSGLSDLIKGHAILFPLGDELSLAKDIMRSLFDIPYRNQIVEKCQKFANKYDMSFVSNLYINTYVELIRT